MITERNFGEWRMGFESDEATIRNLPGFVDFFTDGHVSFLELSGDEKRIKSIMEGFRKGKWRRQAEAV